MIDDPEKIRAFDCRENSVLVDYQVVGLPIWLLNVEVRIKKKSKVTLIEQALISLVYAGVQEQSDIVKLTGLTEQVTQFYLGELLQRGFIDVLEDHLRCTAKGEILAEDKQVLATVNEQVQIAYDPIVKRIEHTSDGVGLWKPFELKKLGTKMMRPSPQRSPKPDELDTTQLIEFLRKQKDGFAGLVSISRVLSRSIRFKRALLLVYKEERSKEVDLEFAIDSRISRDHGRAFIQQKGHIRHGILGGVDGGPTVISDNPAVSGIDSAWAQVAQHRGSGNRASSSLNIPSPSSTAKPVGESADRGSVRSSANNEEVSLVSVYEHPKYLMTALSEAQNQIIVLSPWITDAVVDHDFLTHLRNRLEEGVDVFIGYGINREEKLRSESSKRLTELAKRYQKFRFKRLGDTHAKVLIKDHEYLIASSFNWLSFRGDPDRTFREEWGVCIKREEFVREKASMFRQRFEQSQ